MSAEAPKGRGEDKLEAWARRLEEPPEIDIDAWTLLWEARIVQLPQGQRAGKPL